MVPGMPNASDCLALKLNQVTKVFGLWMYLWKRPNMALPNKHPLTLHVTVAYETPGYQCTTVYRRRIIFQLL